MHTSWIGNDVGVLVRYGSGSDASRQVRISCLEPPRMADL